MMANPIHLLGTRRFLPLFVTQFFGAFNDNAFKNAFLIWFTYDVAVRTGADAGVMVTIAAGLFILPFFLFSATAGQLADKYEKSWLTQKIKQVEIVLMLTCSVCFYVQSIYGLLAVLFLMGVQSTFFGPIKYSLLPEHLKDGELISGNGLIEGGTFLSILLGTIFGGLVIRTHYGFEILSVCVVGFAIIGWVASRSIPRSPIGDAQLKIRWNILMETFKIIGFARQERSVWLSILGISWFWLVGATFLTQFPVYIKEIINGNEHIVALFLAIFSMGIGMGAMLCNRLLKGQIDGRLVPYGSFGITMAIIVFFVSSGMYERGMNSIGVFEFMQSGFAAWFIMGGLLMLSICSGVYIVPLYAIMQHRSDEKYLARIIAANNVMNALFMVIASLFAVAIFAAGFHVVQLLLGVGIINIPVFFAIKELVRRSKKQYV